MPFAFLMCTSAAAELCEQLSMSWVVHAINVHMLCQQYSVASVATTGNSGVKCASRVHWDDPFGGKCQDTFCMSEDGQQLTQMTEMVMKTGRLCNYK